MSDEEREDRNDNGLPREGDLLGWSKETQRTIDFMLRQQAEYQGRAEADMQRLRESQEITDAVVRRFANATLRRFEGVEGEVTNLDRKMEALVDSHIRMADAQKEGEERLNAFIATVERLIQERRNGGGSGGVLDE